MSNLKRKKKRLLDRFSGIRDCGVWELEKTEKDGPGISQPDETFMVVYCFYRKPGVFEKNRNPNNTEEIEKTVTVRLEYLFSEEDINNDYEYIEDVYENAQVDVNKEGMPIVKINGKDKDEQILEPFDIYKDSTEKVDEEYPR